MLTFVNYLGEAVSTKPVEKAKKAAPSLDPYHKGWRVVGLPPGALEEAEKEHKKKIFEARSMGKEILDFNPIEWAHKARRKAVRSKPYALFEAADQCKGMAEKAGWSKVEIIEVSKGNAS